jgi:hypothetical protein
MIWITQLLARRHKPSHAHLAGRAEKVIAKVLFDIGVDNFLNGTLLIDHGYRVRFVSCTAVVGSARACVRASTLVQARALQRQAASAGWRAQARDEQIARLADELMAVLLTQSPTLRALPAQGYEIDEEFAQAR